MQVQSFLDESARRFPDKIALICGTREVSYAAMDRMASRFSTALRAAGVARGDRVVIFLQNSVECVASIFGILKAGAVFVPINPGVKAQKLRHIIDDCSATGLVTDRARIKVAFASQWRPAHNLTVWVSDYGRARQPHLPGNRESLDELLGDLDAVPSSSITSGIDIDLAALLYTSGSSGIPKGVMLTHLNITSAASSIATYLESRHDDVVLNLLPLAFDYGLYQIFLAFRVGATLILHASFAYPWSIITSLMERRVTGFPLLPTIAGMLLQRDLQKYAFPSLRYITSTGAALPVSYINGLQRAFPGVTLYSMYGLTECKRVSYLPPDQLDKHPESIGRGMPNQEVYIVDDRDCRVGPGVTGELVVRGSHVMKGYWNLPQETDRVLRPGLLPGERVLYTGDLFWMDEDGYLYFVGRRDELFKSRGERISPKEIENVITSMEHLAEAAVFGVPDPILGNAIVAIVVPRIGHQVSALDVQRYCALHLEPHAVPHHVQIAHSIPRNERGKVEKRALAHAASTQG